MSKDVARHSNVTAGYVDSLGVLPGNQSSIIGRPDTLQLQGSDPDGAPVTYAVSGLPAGLSLMPSTGLIAGTPTTPQTVTVTATVSDGVRSRRSPGRRRPRTPRIGSTCGSGTRIRRRPNTMRMHRCRSRLNEREAGLGPASRATGYGLATSYHLPSTTYQLPPTSYHLPPTWSSRTARRRRRPHDLSGAAHTR